MVIYRLFHLGRNQNPVTALKLQFQSLCHSRLNQSDGDSAALSLAFSQEGRLPIAIYGDFKGSGAAKEPIQRALGSIFSQEQQLHLLHPPKQGICPGEGGLPSARQRESVKNARLNRL